MNTKLLLTLASLVGLLGVNATAVADEMILVSSHTRDVIGPDPAANGILKGVPLESQALVVDRIQLDGSKVAFRARSGLFVRAGIGPDTHLGATSPHIRGWEKFEIVRLSASKFAIRSAQNGLFVRLGPDGRLAAVSEDVGSRETFSSRRPSAIPEEVRPDPRLPAQLDEPELAGRWRIHRVRTFDGSLIAIPGALRGDTFIRIRGNGRMNASVGCNDISGHVRAEGDLVQFGDVATTKKFCLDERGTYELLLLVAFDHARNLDDMGDQLRFFDLNGEPVMVLRRN